MMRHTSNTLRISGNLLARIPVGTLACISSCILLQAAPALAQDRANIDPTKIIGNRELPKVLYIVPWKKPVTGDLSGRPIDSVLDEALAPLDRDVFRRQIAYAAQTQGKTQTTSKPAMPVTPANTAKE